MEKFISWLYDVSAMLSDFAESTEEEAYAMDTQEQDIELTKRDLAEKKDRYMKNLIRKIEESFKELDQATR